VCFQEVKIFAGKQTFFKYAVTIKFVAVHYTALEMSVILAVKCTVADVDSARRFCLRSIQTVDVRWL
jgi:hypothetical protein